MWHFLSNHVVSHLLTFVFGGVAGHLITHRAQAATIRATIDSAVQALKRNI